MTGLGRLCLAHQDHAPPVPIEVHHVRPVTRGGRGSPTVQLCANAHGQVHDLLDRLEALAVRSPYTTTREIVERLPRDLWAAYPGAVRVIAYKGWLTYGVGFLGGLYDDRYRLWATDGAPRMAGVPVYADVMHAARWSRRWRRELLGQ